MAKGCQPWGVGKAWAQGPASTGLGSTATGEAGKPVRTRQASVWGPQASRKANRSSPAQSRWAGSQAGLIPSSCCSSKATNQVRNASLSPCPSRATVFSPPVGESVMVCLYPGQAFKTIAICFCGARKNPSRPPPQLSAPSTLAFHPLRCSPARLWLSSTTRCTGLPSERSTQPRWRTGTTTATAATAAKQTRPDQRIQGFIAAAPPAHRRSIPVPESGCPRPSTRPEKVRRWRPLPQRPRRPSAQARRTTSSGHLD